MHPSGRITGHQTQQQPFRWSPTWQPAKASYPPEGFGALFQFKMPQIFLNDGGHGHAKGGGEILHRHCLLLFLVVQQTKQAIGQVLRIARPVKLDRQFFDIRHLAKISEVGA